MIDPIHPGEILLEEFLKPMDITQYRLAKAISVPARRINEIVHGKRAVSADTALRLGRYFGTSAEFWINLQTHYDLEKEMKRLASKLVHIVQLFPASGHGIPEPPLSSLRTAARHSRKGKLTIKETKTAAM